MARSGSYDPDFEATYREAFHTDEGVAIPKAEREQAKQVAFKRWRDRKRLRDVDQDEIDEDPIADPGDTPSEALEKIVSQSLKSMTPSDAIKHRSQLLKFAGDTVLLDRKVKIEKQAQATGLSIITELFRQVAEGQVKQGPGWLDATMLPTLSASQQAEEAVLVGETLDANPPQQREAI